LIGASQAGHFAEIQQSHDDVLASCIKFKRHLEAGALLGGGLILTNQASVVTALLPCNPPFRKLSPMFPCPVQEIRFGAFKLTAGVAQRNRHVSALLRDRLEVPITTEVRLTQQTNLLAS
jgi:hypothetical protein